VAVEVREDALDSLVMRTEATEDQLMPVTVDVSTCHGKFNHNTCWL